MFTMFGVVSDQCQNIGTPAYEGLVDFYGIGAGDFVWDLGTSYKFPSSNERYKAKAGGFDLGDLLRMELNQQSSELVFLRDGKELWTLQLPSRKAWYPCIAMG